MKKTTYILLSFFIFIACSKDDDTLNNPDSSKNRIETYRPDSVIANIGDTIDKVLSLLPLEERLLIDGDWILDSSYTKHAYSGTAGSGTISESRSYADILNLVYMSFNTDYTVITRSTNQGVLTNYKWRLINSGTLELSPGETYIPVHTRGITLSPTNLTIGFSYSNYKPGDPLDSIAFTQHLFYYTKR